MARVVSTAHVWCAKDELATSRIATVPIRSACTLLLTFTSIETFRNYRPGRRSVLSDDAILQTGSNRRVRLEIRHERLDVDVAADLIGAFTKHREAIAA